MKEKTKKLAVGSLAEVHKIRNGLDLSSLPCFDTPTVQDDENLDNSNHAQSKRTGHTAASSRKAFAAHLRKAIAESDVVIQVLDARDPNGYRWAGHMRRWKSL